MSNSERRILFNDTEVMSTVTNYYPRLYREAIDIAKRRNNFDRQESRRPPTPRSIHSWLRAMQIIHL